MTQAPERAALCAFGRCRAPLPPPGPRGGRPFEYCPEREWPGGHTCKQLAGAEAALTEALGKTAVPHLSGAASAFVDAAGRVLEPMAALAAALEDLRTSAATELTAAAEQVERTEAEAARERGLREAATQQAERAGQDKVAAETARDAALADARTAREEHAEALRARAQAVAAQRGTELELARVAAERDAAHRQAEQAATTAAATVTAITAAADQRVLAATAGETAAREQAAELRAELKALHHRLAEQDHRLQAAEQAVERVRGEAEQRIERIAADAERRVDQARADTAALRAGHDARVAELGAQTERADRLGRDRDHYRTLLDRISDAVGRFHDAGVDASTEQAAEQVEQVDAVLRTVSLLARERAGSHRDERDELQRGEPGEAL
ncbi:hypothetical protein [Saccharothrix xinjiangensis]|uniref:Uncharacterized protein n=1 Tax=Saccharothrix xinjiangensis TaxID=204798 RepID=A0ABV9Y546_9PSEU